LESRLKEHNWGNTKSTKPYIPWKIVHIEEFKSRAEARIREKYLKSAAGRRWRKENIKRGISSAG
jgi:putative endonuclease